MTAHGLDERAHFDAVSAAIKAQLGPNDVYDYGTVPGLDGNGGKEPDIYVLVQTERRFIPSRSASRLAARTGWRATVRAVGSTVNECRWAALQVAEALDSARLTVGGLTSTPIQHETNDAAELNDGRFESLSRWTYAL